MAQTTFSRRWMLGNATAAALTTVGMCAVPISCATGAVEQQQRKNKPAPRLPMRAVTNHVISEENVRKIKALSPQITLIADPDRFDAELPSADVVFANLKREPIRAAKKLRWLQHAAVGVDALMCPELVDSDIIVTNTRGTSSSPIAEHAIGHMICMTRGIGFAATKRQWLLPERPQVELRGMTMGIVGLGAIGREVARRAKVMDMHVVAVDAEPMFEERYRMADEIYLVDDGLDDMLGRADVVVNCCPLTQRTRGMFGEKQFARMKDGAYFINVSRGPIVQTDALVAALRSKKLAGAGLDVTDPEPLPNDHPLWQIPNAIITPHKAGFSQFVRARETDVFAENVRRYVAGLPMMNLVDKVKGY